MPGVKAPAIGIRNTLAPRAVQQACPIPGEHSGTTHDEGLLVPQPVARDPFVEVGQRMLSIGVTSGIPIPARVLAGATATSVWASLACQGLYERVRSALHQRAQKRGHLPRPSMRLFRITPAGGVGTITAVSRSVGLRNPYRWNRSMHASRQGNGRASINRYRLLKRTYARPSKMSHLPSLSQQSMPSSKRNRPTREGR